MIKLLTFDLDDTLWDVGAVVKRAEKNMRIWLREHYPDFMSRFDVNHFLTIRLAVLRELPHISHDFPLLRLEVLRRAFLHTDFSESAANIAAQGALEEFERWRNTVDYFPDAVNALTELRKSFLLYALSNGTADVSRLGLNHIFTQHFSAVSVGAPKPDPRMFLAAIAAADVAPHEVIHIGDHPEQDVAAAAAVGMRTIWVNFEKKPWQPLAENTGLAPDAELHDFASLPALIKRF